MKLSLFALISVLSVSTFATTLKTQADLDFRFAASGVDAGLYRVTTEITPATQAAETYIERSEERDDNDYFCVSTVKFPVGTMKLVAKNVITGEVIAQEYPLFAETSQRDEQKACTKTNESFVGEQTVYVPATSVQVLPVAAPKGYDEVQVWLHPYLTLRLKTTISQSGKALTLNPATLFTLENIFDTDNYNSLVLSYYLTAVKGSSVSSLAVGNAPMIFVK